MNIIIIIITVVITAIEWRSGGNDVTNDLVLHRILEHKLRANGYNSTLLGVVGQQRCVSLHGALFAFSLEMLYFTATYTSGACLS